VSTKPVIPRALAHRDVEAATDYYLREGGPNLALAFIDALQTAFRIIGASPATGSPRHVHELSLPGLRARALKRHPYLVFYLEREDHIDVWRVLHANRDIPARMQELET